MIYLMRHGQTDWNIDKRIQGHTDIPLNGFGRAEMHRMAVRLREAGFSVDRVAHSPLLRAAETAGIFAEETGFSGPMAPDPQLIERCFGDAEGQSVAQLDLARPVPGMETQEQLYRRVSEVLHRYSRLPGDTLLVTHGGFIMAAMAVLSESDEAPDYRQLPAQGNPIAPLEENGKTVWHYVLP